jgi:hypothetical protein
MTSPATGSRTLTVCWHENAIRGAVDRAAEITTTTEADEPCTITWMDLACLVDIARSWIREQES